MNIWVSSGERKILRWNFDRVKRMEGVEHRNGSRLGSIRVCHAIHVVSAHSRQTQKLLELLSLIDL
jgi:hypothetical protein